jgi:Anti-sigma-K factor rskA
MTPEMTHDEAFAELGAVAFDLLDAAQRDAVMAHVSSCGECRAELDALREAAAELALAAPAASAPVVATRERVRARLLARAASDARARKLGASPLLIPRPIAPPSSPAAVDVPRRTPWFAIAASILLVASLGALGWSLRERQTLIDAAKAQSAVADAARRAADSLSAQVAWRDSLIAGVAGRDVAVMTLTSRAAKDPYARMFWDRARHTWTMIAHSMPDLNSGRTYQLWLVTPKSKISAGTFTVRNGDAIVRATYDLTEPLDAIAVTEEPAGGVAQPTGPVIVAAQAR